MKRRSEPAPHGFARIAATRSRSELVELYRSSDAEMTAWLSALTPEQKRQRHAHLSQHNSEQALLRARDEIERARQAKADRIERERTIAERAEVSTRRRTLEQIIADEAAARDAAKVDPYPGLTGFDRQLAIARDKGIVERPALNAPDLPRSPTGSQMAMF